MVYGSLDFMIFHVKEFCLEILVLILSLLLLFLSPFPPLPVLSWCGHADFLLI